MIEVKSPLISAIEKYPDIPAIIDSRMKVQYSELPNFISHVTGNLSKLNVSSYGKIAILAEPSVDYMILMMALISYPAVACPISNRHPKEVREKQENMLKPDLIINDENIESFIKSNKNKVKINEIWSLDNEASIIFSSGTSGNYKAIVHTLGNHYYSALGSNENIILKPNDRWMLSLPAYHVSGMAILYRCILSGASIVIPPVEYDLNEFIYTNKITHLSVVSSQLKKLIESPYENFTSIKAILVGGEPIPIDIIDSAYKKGLPIYTTYGMTETSSQLTTTMTEDGLDKLYTSGRVLNYRELKIDKKGEILVRGKVLFKSFLDSEKDVDDEGWFYTGDIGSIDNEGYLTVHGRKDNMFISGGENIYPEMIEKVLIQNENIEDVIVAPVADSEYGKRPIAFVKWKNNRIDLSDYLTEKLPRFMHPVKYFEFPYEYKKTDLKHNRSFFVELAKKQTDQC